MQSAILLAFFSTAAIVSTVIAQSTTSTSAPLSVQTIQVGLGGYSYSPNNITAAVGSTLVFEFRSTNHSVVKAAFGIPCEPYNLTYPDQPIFYSGVFNGADTSSADPPTWSLTINDTEPTYFYCTAPDSCVGNHMIGVINPNSTYSLEAQDDYITPSTIMLKPGQVLPAEGTTTSATASASSSKPNDSISGGSIAGITIGAAAVIGLGVALLWYRTRKHNKQRSGVQADNRDIHSAGSGGPSGNNDSRWSSSYKGGPAYGEDKKLMEMQTLRGMEGQPSPELRGSIISPMPELVGNEYGGFRNASNRVSSTASELSSETPHGRVQSGEFSTIHEIG